ncbi:outer membrane pore protein C [Izhakiella capsodis]|uniref:Outer membrane pore protein C n=1 Tax=Izhakiella capsodis TaxID=1367852 RepID=A0A1I4Y1W4_9GAMM|nr:porin OmpC [Izhakiella capsodis]SFN31489.1 outer membrane pore protein C [Izhakiella capsodis]
MKIRILSLMVPALMLAAGGANAAEVFNKDGNKLDIYGKVDGLHYFSKNDSSNGDKSYMRFGLKGETQISDQLTGYGQWEYQYNLNNSEGGDSNSGNATRLGFAGLRFGNAGSFDYGRNYGIIYDVAGWTDVLPEFGGDTYGTDQFMFSRGNGMATYRNNNFFGLVDGLNFAVQYQGKNDSQSGENGRSVLNSNGDGWGLSTTYDLGAGVSLGAAMFQSDRTNAQNAPGVLGHGSKAEAYTGGLKYDANNIYLAAQYTRSNKATRFGDTDNTVYGYANTADNWELVAQYQFDFGLRPSLAFLSSRGHDIQGYGSQNLKKYVDVGTTYFFNKNMSTYVDYQINLLKDNDFTRGAGINTDNVVALGLVYQF